MNLTLFSVFTILILFGADAFFFSSSEQDAPVDCVWTRWSDGKCVHVSGKLYRQELRQKVKAKNGGKDCVGSFERFTKLCSPSEFVAQNFMKTFSQGLISRGSSSAKGPKNQGGGVTRDRIVWPVFKLASHEESLLSKYACSVPYQDPSHHYQMSGRGCSRRRRRAITKQPNKLFPSTRQVRDVLFLLDQSGSVNKDHFKEALEFVKETISKLCDLTEISKLKTRVALASFDEEVHVHMNFDEHFERQDVLDEIGKVGYSSTTSGSTCLVKALQHAREKMFTTAHGARESDDIYNMVVLVTDGCANCDGDLESALKTELQKLENENITFMLVTVGDKSSCSKKISSFANGNHCFLNYEMDSWDDFRDFTYAIKVMKDCFDRWTVPDETCNE